MTKAQRHKNVYIGMMKAQKLKKMSAYGNDESTKIKVYGNDKSTKAQRHKKVSVYGKYKSTKS